MSLPVDHSPKHSHLIVLLAVAFISLRGKVEREGREKVLGNRTLQTCAHAFFLSSVE
jgi:hypothetical protein